MIPAFNQLPDQTVLFPQTDLDKLLQKVVFAPDQFLRDLKAKRGASLAEKTRIITSINRAATSTDKTTFFDLIVLLTLQKIITVAHTLLRSDFENETMPVYDAFLTAAAIVDLERTHHSSGDIFIDKSETSTRSLLYCKSKKLVAVIASPGNAKIKEKGAYKRVVSCAILNLANLTQPARLAVFSHISKLHEDDFKDVNTGFEQLLRVAPLPVKGICSLECVIKQYDSVDGVEAPALVDVKALFEGYQATLNQIIGDVIFVSDLEKLVIMRDLVRGLIHLHKHNVIHGDIKPANALFCVDGTAEGAKGGLNDFDFAFNCRPTMVLGWGYYGSIQFTDPQHYGKEGKDEGESGVRPVEYYMELDGWALGCMLLQLWKHLPAVPWAAHIDRTYHNDFKWNETHKNVDALTESQKAVEGSIEETIENPLNAILRKEEVERSFSEKVDSLLFSLLRYEPQARIRLPECAGKLTSLINEATSREAQLKSQKEAEERTYENCLKSLAVATDNPKKQDRLFDLVLNKSAGKKCKPFTRERAKRLLAAATKIASEKEPHQAKEFFSTILTLFKVLQSARFENESLSVQEAWQLAAYCTIELKKDLVTKAPQHISKTTSGLSHDIQFDPRSLLVTIPAIRAKALKNIEGEALCKHYKSAISFSLSDPAKRLVNTLYMQNNPDSSQDDVQTIVREMKLCDYIRSSLPSGSQMPILLPLSYQQEELDILQETNNYNYISAIYPKLQGSLQDILSGRQAVSFQQKLSLTEQLLKKLCCLHQMGVILGTVNTGNAFFQIKDDDQVEAVWADLRSAYLMNDQNLEIDPLFPLDIYESSHHTEPQFFGSDDLPLTSQEYLGLDAWAFGVMLHEFFIGSIPWYDELRNCYKFVELDKGTEQDISQNEVNLKEAYEKVRGKIEVAIEEPLKQLRAKQNPAKEEQVKILIWELLHYNRQDRSSLDATHKKLITLL